MKKILIIIVITIICFVAYKIFFNNKQNEAVQQYEFTKIESGDIDISVTCTGTLEALGTLEIGTQLSGRIEQVLVDFNDTVKKNQILAILDTTNISLDVRNAESNVMRYEAQYELNKKRYDDNLKLFESDYLSEIDLITSKSVLDQSYAVLQSALINLEKSHLNLTKYSIIRSPINGKILHRNIEAGQTVSASLSAPILFTIVEDLSQMQIHALVDESDIGLIRKDQVTQFTVDTFPDNHFTGIVKQIRLQPENISNVVNYTVIIDAKNSDQILLPGMTATVDIITESKQDIYLIENTALRFTPEKSVLEKLNKENVNKKISIGKLAGSRKKQTGKLGKIWVLDENDMLERVLIRTGISDGINTEVIKLPDLPKDSNIIKKIVRQKNNKKSQDFRSSRRLF